MDEALPVMHRLTPEWVDFFIMAGAIALVAIGALIWVFFLRKPGRRRRRKSHHRHGRRLSNPTLAQNGGLPPVRPEEERSRRQMPTSQP
jgi:hypothetical protein